MSAAASGALLLQAMKELSLEWDQTRSYWRDGKSLEFEEKYLAELPLHIRRAAEAMEEIETVLRKVRADCE
ncbi:MAG: hypothetical protein WC076_07585 [Terrimicrobiaceae bacterium]